MIMRSAAAKLAATSGLACMLAAEPLHAADRPRPEVSCAYWLARSPSAWRSALEETRARWEAMEVTFGDIQRWRAERAKTETSYAWSVSDVIVRNHLKAQAYIKTYGRITDEEAYQHFLVFLPEKFTAIDFDEEGNALNAQNESRAMLEKQISLRPRYEVLRDGLTRVYCFCADAPPEAMEVCLYADSLTDRDIKGR